MGKARSNEHIKAQKDGKIRDGHTCQICGSKKCPEGHHIFDVQYGGPANSENIITLCPDHHKKVHDGKIDITRF